MKKYFLILISLISLIYGCCQDDITYNIPQRRLLKFDKNDLFVYKSNLLNYDTLRVTKSKDTIIFVKTHKTLNCSYTELYKKLDVYLSLVTNGKADTINYDARFTQVPFPEYNLTVKTWYGYVGTSRLYRRFLGRYTIDDKMYYNVTLCEDSTTTEPSKLYYNDENGVISYTTSTGEVFNLEDFIKAN